MNDIAEALRQAEIHGAQMREHIQLAHSLSCRGRHDPATLAAHALICKPGHGLAELVTLDLLASARLLEDRLARVRDAIKEDDK